MTIEKTVGTGVGADFENWAYAYRFLTALGVITDPYDFIQVADIVMDSTTWPYQIYPSGNLIRFICPFEDSHKGSPIAGFTTTFPVGSPTAKVSFYNPGGPDTNGVFEWNGLRAILERTGTGFIIANMNVSYDQYFIFKNMLIDGTNTAGARGVTVGVINSGTKISNVKIYDCPASGYGYYGGGVGGGQEQVRNWVENITVYNCGTGILAKNNFDRYTVFRNVVSCGNVIDWELIPGATIYTPCWQWTYNCADSDGTLSNGDNKQHNIVPANEFESLDKTSSAFLKLKPGIVI